MPQKVLPFKFKIIYNIMANNCCSGNECEKMVTIGWMRELANGHCVEVSQAIGDDNCCEASEDAYAVTYKDVVDEVYAQKRAISRNPILDKNGFDVVNVPPSTRNCCGILYSNDCLIPKSDLTFGYTEISGITFSMGIPPQTCNPDFSVIEYDTYVRYTLECDENEPSYIKISSSSTVYSGTTHSGTLEKKYTINDNGCEALVNVEFSSHTVSASIETCNVTESSSTGVTLEGYDINIQWDDLEGGNLPCDGGVISGTIGDNNCASDVILTSITVDSGGTQLGYIETSEFSITIPQNENNVTSVKVTANFTVGGQELQLSCEYNWETCGFHPVITPTQDCSANWYTEEWGNEFGNQEYRSKDEYKDYLF